MFDRMMNVNQREQATVLALVEATEGEWFRTAALLEEVGSAQRVMNQQWDGLELVSLTDARALAERADASRVEHFMEMLEDLADDGVRLVTVLDEDYPTNLREIYNRPPFLFVRGQFAPADDRSVAVVGTRKASPEGVEQAKKLASELSTRSVTVLSGLALGIDTAAHEATLETKGRTVAVLGHGIKNEIYPRQNVGLANRIVEEGGALVSQFWPTAPPTRYSFPMRNVVMSGLGIGTVVVEASGHSGAKMQARLCLEHGKRLFLVESLVLQENWARTYSQRPGAKVVTDVEDVIDVITQVTEAPEQLAFY